MEARYCYLFGAAEFDGNLKFKPDQGRDFIIAADAGYRHLQALGIPPDMLIGDFDSLGEVPKGVELLRFPVMKDDTDLMLAVKYGFAHGYREFIIYGGMGGRLDFTLANFQILSSIVNNGGSAYLIGCGSMTTAVRDASLLFDASFRGKISIFCSGERACDVTLRGLKYPLEQAVLKYDEPLGISNEFIGENGLISVGNGMLIVIYDDANPMMTLSKNNPARR